MLCIFGIFAGSVSPEQPLLNSGHPMDTKVKDKSQQGQGEAQPKIELARIKSVAKCKRHRYKLRTEMK
jgi:hypothetical protein